MKKNVLAILFVGLVSFGAFAQDSDRPSREKPTPEKIAEQQTNRIKEQVGLTDDQYDALYALNLDKAKKEEAERVAYQTQLESILSAEQLEKLKTSKPDRPQRGDGNRPSRKS